MSDFNAAGVSQNLLSITDTSNPYAALHEIDQLGLGPVELKQLDFHIMHEVIAGVANFVPHLNDPLSDNAYRDLRNYYEADTAIYEGIPGFVNHAGDLAGNYTQPSITEGVGATDPRLLILSVAAQHKTNSETADSGGAEAADELIIEQTLSHETARTHVTSRVVNATFGAAHAVLAEQLFLAQSTAEAEFIRNQAGIQAVLAAPKFAVHATQVAAQSLLHFNRGHETWLRAADDSLQQDPEHFDSIPIGCPAGRLIVWAPRLLFTAGKVIVDARRTR